MCYWVYLHNMSMLFNHFQQFPEIIYSSEAVIHSLWLCCHFLPRNESALRGIGTKSILFMLCYLLSKLMRFKYAHRKLFSFFDGIQNYATAGLC
jgi:hypothetical protein